MCVCVYLLVQIINNKVYGFIDRICLVQKVLCNHANKPALKATCLPPFRS